MYEKQKSRHRRFGLLLLQPLYVPERPRKSISIDFLCGLPPSKGNTMIMVVVDRFSKMIHLIPFKDIPNSVQTAKAFTNNIYKLMVYAMILLRIEDHILQVNFGMNFYSY